MPLHLPFGNLFTAKRNRVEFLCDFPEGDDAEVISSLQLYPQGWVAVTRNLSADEESEWCCVHDVHGSPDDDEGGAFMRQMEERKSLGSYESAGQTGGIFNLEFNTEG